MIDQNVFKDMTPAEKRKFLADNAFKKEEGRYFKRLTVEELVQEKDKYSAESIVLMNIEDEFERVKGGFKERINDKKKSNEILLKKISLRGVFLSGDTFLFVDQSAGIVYIYDSEGTLVDMREIRPEERQLNLHIQLNQSNG